MNWDAYNKENELRKKKDYERAMATFNQAAELARCNGWSLLRHSPWHFSLNHKENGGRKCRYNLYPSNQRIWGDPKYKGPYLKVTSPWTFLDVVSAAIIQTQCLSPKQISRLV